MEKKIIAYRLMATVYKNKKYSVINITASLDKKIMKQIEAFIIKLEKSAA